MMAAPSHVGGGSHVIGAPSIGHEDVRSGWAVQEQKTKLEKRENDVEILWTILKVATRDAAIKKTGRRSRSWKPTPHGANTSSLRMSKEQGKHSLCFVLSRSKKKQAIRKRCQVMVLACCCWRWMRCDGDAPCRGDHMKNA
jgi:hypothetical protein